MSCLAGLLLVILSLSTVGVVQTFHVSGAVRPSWRRIREDCRCHPGVSPHSVGVLAAGGVATEGELEKARAMLQETVDTRKVDKINVSEALDVLSQVGRFPNLTADDVEGTWELVFSTQLKSGYMPVRELIQFYPSRKEILIDTKAGPVPLGGVRGDCTWEGGDVNELVFSISAMQFGPIKIGRKTKTKTYQFFLSEGEIMAAKSSAGSLSLLLRIPG